MKTFQTIAGLLVPACLVSGAVADLQLHHRFHPTIDWIVIVIALPTAIFFATQAWKMTGPITKEAMPVSRFTLIFSDGAPPAVIEGSNLRAACLAARIQPHQLLHLDGYEVDGGPMQLVAGEADCDCGCAPQASNDFACEHDLARVGLGEYKL